MNDNTQKASANIQVEFTLDELSKKDWFGDNIEESICILLSNNDPVLTEYIKEKRVIPNLEQIKQLCPEFYDSAIILGTYDGTRVTFELGEIMSNDNQRQLRFDGVESCGACKL